MMITTLIMVIAGLGGLMSLGLAMPTGLAFGYGYGYGVRQGYHAFRPSKNDEVKKLHLSPDPIQGAKGAGLLSAEEMTSKQAPKVKAVPIQPAPVPQKEAHKITTPTPSYQPKPAPKPEYKYSRNGKFMMTMDQITAKGKKHGLDARTSFKRFVNEEYPFVSRYGKPHATRSYTKTAFKN